MMAVPPQGMVLALHPSSRGFGWAALPSPLSVYCWGLVETPTDKNKRCIDRVAALIEEHQPDTLVVEAFEYRVSARSDRIAALGRALAALAAERGIEFNVYSRTDVQQCFETVGARTRQEVADAVARHFPELAHHLPSARKPWKTEDRRMALFAAVGAALTHFQVEGTDFLESMKPST